MKRELNTYILGIFLSAILVGGVTYKNRIETDRLVARQEEASKVQYTLYEQQLRDRAEKQLAEIDNSNKVLKERLDTEKEVMIQQLRESVEIERKKLYSN